MKKIPSKPMEKQKALARLQTSCARSEHCEWELREKLQRWQVNRADADSIIDSLIDERYLDEARFARAFVNDKVRFGGYGRNRIRLALIAKRVDKDVINRALDSIDEEEYSRRLSELLAAKLARTPDTDSYEGRNKVYRYGLSRGFESDAVVSALRKLLRK